MVIKTRQYSERGALMIVELFVAMAIILIAVLPLSFSAGSEARSFRAVYQRAVAMEIVDGEMEILAAGAWHDFSEGPQPYAVHAKAAANLPAGQFVLTRTGQHLRLEWASAKKVGIGPVVREATVR